VGEKFNVKSKMPLMIVSSGIKCLGIEDASKEKGAKITVTDMEKDLD